jgi:hypothetical protein
MGDEHATQFSTPKPRRFNPLAPQPIGVKQSIEPPGGLPFRQVEEIQAKLQPGEGNTSQVPPPEPPPQPETAPPQDPPESD